jgi:ketosteroid isomerase-like protein
MTFRRIAALAALSLAACAPSLIPGTGVENTLENQEVYAVIKAYAVAMQNKDAAAVLALVDPKYYDGAGTPLPDDDLDRAGLEKSLAADFAKVDTYRLEVTVRKIEVKGDQATADLVYDNYFRVMTPAGGIPKRESDLHRMWFHKVDKRWFIISGL